jgi:hypothetical protein
VLKRSHSSPGFQAQMTTAVRSPAFLDGREQVNSGDGTGSRLSRSALDPTGSSSSPPAQRRHDIYTPAYRPAKDRLTKPCDFAVVSDSDGNLTARKAVIADLERRGVELVVQAGDLALMGAAAVIDRIASWAGRRRGKHRRAALAPPTSMTASGHERRRAAHSAAGSPRV